jgi:hypothetical protein
MQVLWKITMQQNFQTSMGWDVRLHMEGASRFTDAVVRCATSGNAAWTFPWSSCNYCKGSSSEFHVLVELSISLCYFLVLCEVKYGWDRNPTSGSFWMLRNRRWGGRIRLHVWPRSIVSQVGLPLEWTLQCGATVHMRRPLLLDLKTRVIALATGWESCQSHRSRLRYLPVWSGVKNNCLC